MHSLTNKARRKKTTKQRKSDDDLSSDLRRILPAAAEGCLNNLNNEDRPPLPPLPSNYKQLNYEKTYVKNAGLMPKSNPHHTYAPNETTTNLEQQNRLLYQRQLSKSVGDNLQQCKPQNKFSTLDGKNRQLRQCLSAGDLLGKTHEELLLLLIQLKRNQSQLKHTIEKLRLQMESEDKLSIIEPHKVAEHKLKYEQVKEQLIETQKQYESQFPLIDMIDNMVRFNSNSKSNLNAIYGYNQSNQNLNSLSSTNVYLSSTQQNGKDKRNAVQSVGVDSAKATSTSYLNRLEQQEQTNNQRRKRITTNDESDYACESDTNNVESTYTNRSSCTGLSAAAARQLSENQDVSMNRTLEIPSSSSHKKAHSSTTTKSAQQSNSKASEQTSSQATNTLSSVISSVKPMHKIASNSQVNQQSPAINQTSVRKPKTTSTASLAEEEMNRMKEQQMLLEAELERVRTMLMNSQQLNVPSQSTNLNDDLSVVVTTTENHFQAELANIDQEIHNLNAKKEKLIQSLKRKEDSKQKEESKDDQLINKSNDLNHQLNIDRLEDGTDLFTDDDAIFSTVNSIDFERVLDDNLSLCTDVDDLELSKHENEYVNTLKAEYEQNLKQLEEERRKLEQFEGEQRDQSIANDAETTTETTIYKTLRMVKRKYESSKLNKQLTFDSGDVLRIDNVDVRHSQSEKSTDGKKSIKSKVFSIRHTSSSYQIIY